MVVKTNPFLEVFAHPVEDLEVPKAAYETDRSQVGCAFKKNDGLCHKSSRTNPIGACTLTTNAGPVVLCPNRFLQDDIIFDSVADVANLGKDWFVRSEPTLKDTDGNSLGNVDFTLVYFDKETKTLVDYVPIEVQAVYTSGSTRAAFNKTITGEVDFADLGASYPTPDFLSSWKRLKAQLQSKGSRFAANNKFQAVVVDQWFIDQLRSSSRTIPTTNREEANMVFLAFDIISTPEGNKLVLKTSLLCDFDAAMNALDNPLQADFEALEATLSAAIATHCV